MSSYPTDATYHISKRSAQQFLRRCKRSMRPMSHIAPLTNSATIKKLTILSSSLLYTLLSLSNLYLTLDKKIFIEIMHFHNQIQQSTCNIHKLLSWILKSRFIPGHFNVQVLVQLCFSMQLSNTSDVCSIVKIYQICINAQCVSTLFQFGITKFSKHLVYTLQER